MGAKNGKRKMIKQKKSQGQVSNEDLGVLLN